MGRGGGGGQYMDADSVSIALLDILHNICTDLPAQLKEFVTASL